MVLVHKPHPEDKFAIVLVIPIWKDAIQQARTQSIEIQEELPGFVTACEFLSDVTWRTFKGTGEIVKGVRHSLPMHLPDIVSKDCP